MERNHAKLEKDNRKPPPPTTQVAKLQPIDSCPPNLTQYFDNQDHGEGDAHRGSDDSSFLAFSEDSSCYSNGADDSLFQSIRHGSQSIITLTEGDVIAMPGSSLAESHVGNHQFRNFVRELDGSVDTCTLVNSFGGRFVASAVELLHEDTWFKVDDQDAFAYVQSIVDEFDGRKLPPGVTTIEPHLQADIPLSALDEKCAALLDCDLHSHESTNSIVRKYYR